MNNYTIIGDTGFVGSTLKNQIPHYNGGYNRSNIQLIDNHHFDGIICCGAPAQKWLANQEPDNDWNNIKQLIHSIDKITCQSMILISTVDVFASPVNVDEQSPVDTEKTTAYGRHRYFLEQHVRQKFPGALIVRLPGLVGPGLKKNILYDLKNRTAIEKIDPRSTYQFYPMKHLWRDIGIAMKAELDLIHLTAEPVYAADMIVDALGDALPIEMASGHPARYDFRTRYGHLWGDKLYYQYSAEDSRRAFMDYLSIR